MLPSRWIKAVWLQQFRMPSPHLEKGYEYRSCCSQTMYFNLTAARRFSNTAQIFEGIKTRNALRKKEFLPQPPVTLTRNGGRYRSGSAVACEIDTLRITVASLPKPLAGDYYGRRLRKELSRQMHLPSLSPSFPGLCIQCLAISLLAIMTLRV